MNKPSKSSTRNGGVLTRRWVEQRWLIDNIIRSVSNVPSTNLGPTPTVLIADWMNARLAGKPLASERWHVESSGRVVRTPIENP